MMSVKKLDNEMKPTVPSTIPFNLTGLSDLYQMTK